MRARPEPPAAGQYEGKTERITDPARIGALLLRLKAERALLRVYMSGAPETYASAVLEVNADRGVFVIDELTPANGNRHVTTANHLHVQSRLQGVEISFDAALRSAGEEDGVALYHLALPDTLLYFQQRAHYRARAGLGKSIPVRLTRENGKELKADLHDLSLGGLGLRFTGALPADFGKGERIPRCVFQAAGGEEIVCPVEMRFLESGGGKTRLAGARFIDLTPLQQAIISRFVAHLDREAARKSHQARG